MRRLLVALGLLALLILAAPRSQVRAGSRCSVPKSWGPLKAMTWSNGMTGGDALFAFEDAEGHVRVTVAGCKPGAIVYEVTRTE
jgi:hypothetical protein